MFGPLGLEGPWLRYATLQNLIPSFPGIAPGWRGGIKFGHLATLPPNSSRVILFLVVVPPEKPRIFSDRGKEVRLKLGPYEIGDDVRLRCEAYGGRPLAKVTWWRDHALLDDSFQVERDKVQLKSD